MVTLILIMLKQLRRRFRALTGAGASAPHDVLLLTAAAALLPLLACLVLAFFPELTGDPALSRADALLLYALGSRLLAVGVISAAIGGLLLRQSGR